jgi:RNA polymerase sigma-70 factor (ECF subfamily)
MTSSDAAVIQASLADPAAFAAIFDRHAASLHRFLARRVEPADADSLLGDVFRIAFERRGSFEPAHVSARPWLYGIATNLIARHRRSEARRLRAMASLAARRVDDADAGADAVADRAAEAIDAGESWSLLVDAVDGLPDVERHALLLYAWEELSYEEVAAALGVPVGTVRSRLNRARRRLRAARSAGERAPRPAPVRPRTEHRTEDSPR